MKQALSEIAQKITRLLENDDFPARVEPAYLRQAVRDYPLRGGKRIRPAVLTWCCGLLGGDGERALYPAAAIEVFHNWTLVHDDIIDEDAFRRGIPACHVNLENALRKDFRMTGKDYSRFAVDFAILAGDLQQGWSNDLLLRAAEHGVKAEVVLELAQMLQRNANAMVITGEALDVELSFRDLLGVSAPEIEKMFLLKTSALLEFAARAGAMCALNYAGCAQAPEVQKLGSFAAEAGIAFQLRDDYLGLFGSGKFGKPIGADLKEKKATVLMVRALQSLKESDRTELLSMLGREEYSAEMLEKARSLVMRSGAVRETAEMLEAHVGNARKILQEFPQNRYRTYLEQMLENFISRES